MTKNTNKTAPWFKPGWNKKRDSELTWQQVKKILGNARTDEELLASFAELTNKEQWEIFGKYFAPPKENVVKSEGSVTISLVLDGLTKTKEIEGELVDHKALPVDNSDDEPVDNS